MKSPKPESAINRTIATMESEIKQRKKSLAWCKKHRQLFDDLAAEEIEGQFWYGNIDFNHLPHKKVLKIMRTFKAGKWKKALSSSCDGARVDYTSEFDGMTIRCYAGEPPPSCKIVEEVVMIPAHNEAVRKLVCPKTAVAA